MLDSWRKFTGGKADVLVMEYHQHWSLGGAVVAARIAVPWPLLLAKGRWGLTKLLEVISNSWVKFWICFEDYTEKHPTYCTMEEM